MRKRIFAVLFLILTTVSSIAANGRCQMLPIDDGRSIRYSCIEATLDDIKDLDKQTDLIQFSVSKLHYIPKQAFSCFALRSLLFYNCDIRYIDPDAFQGLPDLERLNFYGSHINVLKASWFKGLKSLTHLSLKKNNIVYIEPQVFREIPNLSMLNIADNELDCLPEYTLAVLRKLKNLRIENNPWLCSCYEELRSSMVNRYIQGDKNYSEYECMVEYNTQIEESEPRSSTRKWTISNDVELLKTFKTPTSLSDLSAVCKILPHTPKIVESIELSEITIPIIPNFAFIQFGNNLKSLNISNCHINEISPEAFAGLPMLEQLILNNISINTVKHHWFQDLRVLKYLALDNNRIRKIDPKVFDKLTELETFSLNNNNIECLSKDSLSLLGNLKRVNIKNNPWICECRENFKMWLNSTQIEYEISNENCIQGQAKATEYRYELESWKNSTEQTSGSKSTEISYQRNETIYERHEKVTSSEYHANFTWQQQHKHESQGERQKRMIQHERQTEETIQHGQKINQRWQQNNDQSWEYKMSAPVDFTSIQANFHGTEQINQELRIHSRCRRLPYTGMVIWTCSNATLRDLDGIFNKAQAIIFENSIIDVIPDNAFERFGGNLVILEFLNCRIQRIEPQAFAGLVNLRELVLRGNNIREIRSSWFANMNYLGVLKLPQNSIKTIQSKVFLHLHELQELDISGNQLNCISLNSEAYMRNLRKINITNNPWTCLCLRKMIERMDKSGIDYGRIDLGEESIGKCEIESLGTTSSPKPPNPDHLPCKSIRGDYRCVGGDLDVLSDIPNDVESIEIVNSVIPRLPATVFKRFFNLRRLILSNCSIQDIDSLAFDGLYNLKSLSISKNNISIVKSIWFYNLNALTELRLIGNSIRRIEVDVFQILHNLETLSLENNLITCIHTKYMNPLNKLKIVSLQNNPWTPRCCGELTRFLKTRNISYDKFDFYNGQFTSCSIPANNTQENQGNCAFIGSINNPSSSKCVGGDLYILEMIPDSVESIEIINSTILQLPAEVFKRFFNLKKLILSNCNIQDIDSLAFDGLYNLKSLSISNNNISIVKSIWFKDLNALTELRLIGNSITTIEVDVFKNLYNLETLSLDDNLITCIHLNSTNPLNKLKEVSLQNNPWGMDKTNQGCCRELTRFLNTRHINYTRFDFYKGRPTSCGNPAIKIQGNCTFNGSVNNYINCTCVGGDLYILGMIPDTIERIEIIDSMIPELPARIFEPFTNLKQLVLYNCSIRNIHPQAFYGLHKLESLILSENHIPTIKSAWFDELTTLTELQLTRDLIKEIEGDVFQKLPNLKTLSLEDNLISCIFTRSLSSLNKLEKVSLRNNPLKWRSFSKLTEFFEKRNVRYTKFDTYQERAISCGTQDDDYHVPNEIGPCGGTTNTSISTVNVICVSLAMLIFTKI